MVFYFLSLTIINLGEFLRWVNWRLIYANWQTGGLSKSAYCREHNISINRFRYHAVKLECCEWPCQMEGLGSFEMTA
jgi:hypothetical protein